ncbi:hypothetical protein [Lentilactobacillus otakiensis]|uniref:hypothetical protein n=1 Tax=Lentilactobacillus otakiensis TaxID=481720 RepID=UPI003D167C34
MKRALITVGLMLVLPLGLFGCSNNSGSSNSSSSSSTKTEQTSSTSTSEVTPTTSNAKRAKKVRYEKANFTTTLDHEYLEENVYKDVPGTVDHNKIYQWDDLKVTAKTKVHVDKKAVATFKDDDDNEFDHEDFYRVTFDNSKSNQHYWVGDDVLQNDHENDYDD